VHNGYIRQGLAASVPTLEIAAKVVVLALTVLLVTQIAKQGMDSISAATQRLRGVPAVLSILLKFCLMVLIIRLGTSFVEILLTAFYFPWWINTHGLTRPLPHFPTWLTIASGGVGRCSLWFV